MSTALQHARSARAHEVAAVRHEQAGVDKHEQHMKAAGAEMFAAIALLANEAGLRAPPSSGVAYEKWAKRDGQKLAQPIRNLLDNLNQTAEGKGETKDREWVKRIVQWHTDPKAAAARRQLITASMARSRLTRKEKESPGVNVNPRSEAPLPLEPNANYLPVRTQSEERPLPAGSATSRAVERARAAMRRISDRLASAPLHVVEEAADALEAVARDLEDAA